VTAEQDAAAPGGAGGPRAILAIWPAVAGAFAFRYAAYAAMTAMALWAEMRPSPTLPDALLAHLPYVPWIDRANYWLWLVLYLPLTVALLWREPRRWVRYMVTGGLVSLARGFTIALTGLGVPDPAHAGPGIGARDFGTAFVELLSPAGVFDRGAIAAYLTKDLFFSGHVATTFLLWLYLRGRPPLAAIALAANLAVTASVLLSHIHYSIDVVGAWAITFAIFALREGWPGSKRSLPTP
jgi:membrane-associated phospholipid phosphatase